MTTLAVQDAEFVEEPGSSLSPQQQAAPAMFGTDDPVEVVTRAVRVADALKAVVDAKGLIKDIKGKKYPLVEAWLTLGAMLRLTTICDWTRKVDGGWEARISVRDASGAIIGAAEAQCTRDEAMWKSREEYALRSMAQTRATSKALRSVLGFVMTLSGYQATPAEEMPPPEPGKPTFAAPTEPVASGPQRVRLPVLMAAHKAAGEPHGTLAAWLVATIPGYTQGRALTVEESIDAHELLVASPPPSRENTPPVGGGKAPSDAQRGMFFALVKELQLDEKGRRDLTFSACGKRSTKDMTAQDMTAAIKAANSLLDALHNAG
ncbi:MAG: hypothetical protein NVS2B17_29120 [Candidatus Velthaea sp.]